MTDQLFGLPKETLDRVFHLLGQMPAHQSRGVMAEIEAKVQQCQPIEVPEIELDAAS